MVWAANNSDSHTMRISILEGRDVEYTQSTHYRYKYCFSFIPLADYKILLSIYCIIQFPRVMTDMSVVLNNIFYAC